jgi:hypothetical protein
MNRELLLEELAELPEFAQQQVLDFVAFLRTRYEMKRPESEDATARLDSEPFVGMWRDRQDMQDSTRWVRNSRRRDW